MEATKHQRKQLAEIKAKTGMFFPPEISYDHAKAIIDASPLFAQERRERRRRGRRKGFAHRDRRRKQPGSAFVHSKKRP